MTELVWNEYDETKLPPWAKNALVTMRKRWHRIVVTDFDTSSASRTMHVQVQRDNGKSPWRGRRVWAEKGIAYHQGCYDEDRKGPVLKVSELNRSDDQLRHDRMPMKTTSVRRMALTRERNKGNSHVERPLTVQSLLVERTEILEALKPLDFAFVRTPTGELLSRVRKLRDRLDDIDSILVDMHEETEEKQKQQQILAWLEAMTPVVA